MTPMRLPYPRDFADANPPEPEQRMKKCSECGGKGWIIGEWHTPFEAEKETCPTCHGTGEVPREEPEPQFDTEEERDGKR